MFIKVIYSDTVILVIVAIQLLQNYREMMAKAAIQTMIMIIIIIIKKIYYINNPDIRDILNADIKKLHEKENKVILIMKVTIMIISIK